MCFPSPPPTARKAARLEARLQVLLVALRAPDWWPNPYSYIPGFGGTWIWGQFNALGAPNTQVPTSALQPQRERAGCGLHGACGLHRTGGEAGEGTRLRPGEAPGRVWGRGVQSGCSKREGAAAPLRSPAQAPKRANVCTDRFPFREQAFC